MVAASSLDIYSAVVASFGFLLAFGLGLCTIVHADTKGGPVARFSGSVAPLRPALHGTYGDLAGSGYHESSQGRIRP